MGEKPPTTLTCHKCEVDMVIVERAILEHGEWLTWECQFCGKERTLYVASTSQNSRDII